MVKTAHNQVRQVLMNELGLTREFVREEVRTIVAEVVEKQIAHHLGNTLEDMLERKLNRMLDDWRRGHIDNLGNLAKKTVASSLQAAVEEAIERTIMPRLMINVGITGATE